MERAFFAMLGRLKLIKRWSLMRNNSSENVMEHSFQVATLAHALALIRARYCADGRPPLRLETLLLLALYHDAGEILTGDMPTPIKYQTEALRRAYAQVESNAAERLLAMLPEELREDYRGALCPELDAEETREALRVVKAADSLCAYLKCVEEDNQGNRDFAQAKEATLRKLRAMELPELDYFLEHFAPAFALSLDDLQRPEKE